MSAQRKKRVLVSQDIETDLSELSPSLGDRLGVALAVRQLAEEGNFSAVNEIIQVLWTGHCHPDEPDDQSFVAKDPDSVNKYEFDLERLPNEMFWRLHSKLGL